MPGAASLMNSAGLNFQRKDWDKMSAEEKMAWAGPLATATGLDTKFMSPAVVIRGGEQIVRAPGALWDMQKQAYNNWQKYGIEAGLASYLPGGLGRPITGYEKARQGVKVKRGDKIVTIYKPKTFHEKAYLTVGLTPMQLAQRYEQAFGKPSPTEKAIAKTAAPAFKGSASDVLRRMRASMTPEE